VQRVMNRATSLALLASMAAACATSAPPGRDDPPAESVREHLATQTRLVVDPQASTGSVTARRRASTGWVDGITPLAIDSGELAVALEVDGTLAVRSLVAGVEPVAIPVEVFGTPASLSDVRLVLADDARGPVTWSSDDDATVRVTLALDLEWTISVNGGKTPLGAQHLPPIDVDMTLRGDGVTVDASLALAADGELWSWAGLLELSHLELALGARSTNEPSGR